MKKIVLLLVVSLMLISMTVSAADCTEWEVIGLPNGPFCLNRKCGFDTTAYCKILTLRRYCTTNGYTVPKTSARVLVLDSDC